MENTKTEDKNQPEKTVREHNLKFSVEFENGEIAGNKEEAYKTADSVDYDASENGSEIVNQTAEHRLANDELKHESKQTKAAKHIKTTKRTSITEYQSTEQSNSVTRKMNKYSENRENHVSRPADEHNGETSENITVKDERVKQKVNEHKEEPRDTKKHEVHEANTVSGDDRRGIKRKTDHNAKDVLKLPPIKGSQHSPRESKSFGKQPRSDASVKKWERPGDTGEIPIQARIRGPGPGHYLLPSTFGNNADVTKRHSPAFSFGSRSWSFKTDSPGPAYSFDPLLGSKGKENRPSFSFGVRPKTPPSKNITPGPGAYNTDRKPLWERNAPQFSMSTRNKMRSVDAVPSPNTYQLPSTLGDRVPHQRGAPAASLYGRRDKQGYAEDLANTPGPAKYGSFSPSLTKRKSPEYSLPGRTFTDRIKNFTPGPGAYNPQDVNSHMPQAPRHRIGVRHSEFIMPTLTPADVSD